jgi:hypothetical protein
MLETLKIQPNNRFFQNKRRVSPFPGLRPFSAFRMA